MLRFKHFIIILIILFIPWLNALYSWEADKLRVSEYIPPNKCVQIVKMEIYEKNFIAMKTKPDIQNYIQPKKEEKKSEKKVSEEKKEELKKPLRKILIVGDSLGEGLYLAYYKRIKKEDKCLKVKFFVKHSTTTRTWRRNKAFLKELASGKYDLVLVVLGANEFAMDKTSLYYNINKFLIEIRKTNPEVEVFWIVPAVPNKYLRKYVEECLGKDYTIAMDDFINEIPLSKDKIHPDIKKNGYTKLWHIVLNKLAEYREIDCLK
ncbi:MAG: hypothetical protein DSY66_06005 [Persephonella sp.]|nr:MAG: hypothetical protein DSY66_06005 [Persephonella sp.]RUM60102.1 MAG: hypothetical protein DSY53_01440 [Persephonella sp.]